MVTFTWFLVPETNGEHRILQTLIDLTNFALGLSLEDMNELFAQDNIRARSTPFRLSAIEVIEASEDLKLDLRVENPTKSGSV